MKKGLVIWLTGLPCSGKTTIAKELLKHLKGSVLLDGDEIRKTLSSDLGFSPDDRRKHLIRVAHVAKFIADGGQDVICAFVSPNYKVRREIADMIGSRFIVVWVNCPPDVCEYRDVKGMWEKARAGEIKDFTGFSANYEFPFDAQVICNTDVESVEQSVMWVLRHLNEKRERAFYIGRWQPLHEGHREIIRQSLDRNVPVLIGVRDMLPDLHNPLSAEEVKYKLEKEYADDDVEVIIVPNIRSVNKGRRTGWNVVEHKVSEEIAAISATEIRKAKRLNIGDWDT